MNNVVISGTLGKDIKLSQLDNGIKVFNNTICIVEQSENERYTWVNIVAYEELAEFIVKEYQKDEYVIVQGKLKTRSWDNEGEKRYLTEVLIYRIEGVD